MLNYTKKEMEFLKKYENQMYTAVHSNYCRYISSSELLQIQRIYERVSEAPYSLNMSCGHCVLKLIRSAGRLYFQQKEKKDGNS